MKMDNDSTTPHPCEYRYNTLQKIIESKAYPSILENCRDTKIDAVRYLFAFDPDNLREFCTNYLESIIKKIEASIQHITKFNNHKDCNKYADDYRKYVAALGLLIKIYPYNNSYLEKLLDFIIIRQYGYDLDWDILFDISNNYSIDNQYIQKLEEISEENILEICPLFRVKIKYIIFKISAEYTKNRFIDYLEKVIEEENSKAELSYHSQDILLESCYALLKLKQNNITVNETLKRLIFESEQSWIIDRVIQYLPYNTLNESDLIRTIYSFKHELSDSLFQLLWQVTENMSYSDFYNVWNHQPEIIHPEILEISPLGNTAIAQTLNQQILDLSSQLQFTEKTYPLVINAKSLEKITNENSLSQALCNKIYKRIFPQITDIPKVNDPSDLEREIIKIKGQIQKENLALIFHKGEPNETLISVCEQLTDEIYYKLITKQPIFIKNQPIEHGFSLQKNPENLVNILQNWINQLD